MGVAAVVQVDLVLHGHLFVDPGVGVVPGLRVHVALEVGLQIADPVLAVATPGQGRVAGAIGVRRIGRIVGLQVVPQDLDHANGEIAPLQEAVHGIKLHFALFAGLVRQHDMVGGAPVDQIVAGGLHGDAPLALPELAFAVD